MESETEGSPLLRSLSTTPQRKNFCKICRRIPSEVTITGIILGLFLIVVTLLILLENMESSSKEELTVDTKLLASPLKYNKKIGDELFQEKFPKKTQKENDNKHSQKVKDWLYEWRKSYHVDKFEDSLQKRLEVEKELLEVLQSDPEDSASLENLLSSPFKFNKKAFDKSWQNKKDFTKPNKDNVEKWEVFNKNQQMIDNTGSPFKYNKKAFDKTWQDKKKEFAKFNEDYNNKKWDNVNKGWKKILPSGLLMKSPEKQSPDINLLGSPFMIDRKEFDEDSTKLNALFGSMKWDNVNKGWKKNPGFGSPFMIDREEFDKNRADFNAQYGSMKWDNVDKGFKKNPHLDSQKLIDMKEFYEAWKNAEDRLKSETDFNNKNGKKFGKGCSTFSNRTVAAPPGCPFLNMDSNTLQAAAIPQPDVNCELLAEQVRRDLGRCIDLSFLPKECKPTWRNKCFSTYKYRKIDGSCNNEIHPTWGTSGTPFVRMIAPDYGDGVSSIRKAKNGEELPNARVLSQKLYTKQMKPDINVTLLFLGFGLIIDHDMVETAVNTDGLPCCDVNFEDYPQNRPRECLQIEVPEDDPFYGPRNVRCLNVVRSRPVHGECVGRREQLNKATSFLDGSAVYGSTMQKAKSLRSFTNGQLRTQQINNAPYMMFAEGSGYSCGTPDEPLKCFEAGDSRVNMLVELTAMHTLWYREHNRIATELHKINPKWTDETLYQEARRILIAEIQHIAFNEFLPLLLGEEGMDFFEINIDNNMYYDGYDDTTDPSVYNVFGAAAFRFGHSLVQDVIKLVGPDNKTAGSVALHETYFNPQLLYHNGLDLLLRGAASQKLRSVDSFIGNEVREHLFQPANKDFGHDLAAVGIQRGRDHGLPTYTKWRTVCGLSALNSWDDLKTVMNVERANKLKEVYQSLEDIDLIPGALAENHLEGSLLGPTYLCIIGRQFKKTRKGDRFWFEQQNKIGSFTKDQLQEIYNSNMARIVCDNSDKIQRIQRHTFKVASSNNPVINCQDIPKVDLSKWKSKSFY